MTEPEYKGWFQAPRTTIELKHPLLGLGGLFKYLVEPGTQETVIFPDFDIFHSLLILPKYNPKYDPFCLERYRVRPQVYNRESEKLLLERNHRVVSWMKKRLNSPTKFVLLNRAWCEKYQVNYQLFNYCELVVYYCRNILPGTSPKQVTFNKLKKAFSKHENMWEMSWEDLRTESGEYGYVDRLRFQDRLLTARFHEYAYASRILVTIQSNPLYLNEMRAAMESENKRISTANRTDTKQRYSGDFDTRILTQCIFCYRFHLQSSGKRTRLSMQPSESEKRNQLSIYCPACEGRYVNWRSYLTNNTIYKQSDVHWHGC